MARPVGLDVDTASGSETASTKTDISPSTEKRPKFNESGHTSSEKENYEKSDRPQVTRQSSQLRRQYSLDAQREKGVENKDQSSERVGVKDQILYEKEDIIYLFLPSVGEIVINLPLGIDIIVKLGFLKRINDF